MNVTVFYEALLAATGLGLGSDGAGRSNDNPLVSKAYTAKLDLQPGDEFEFRLGRKPIKLIPAISLFEQILC